LADSDFVPSDEPKQDALFTIVGESPGRTEVAKGQAFVGQSGTLLWNVLGQMNIVRDRVNVTNAVLCAPPSLQDEKEEVLAAAASCCRDRLISELKQRPGRVLALGKSARESLMGPQREGESITTLHGRWTYIPELDEMALATYHPAFVMRSPDDAKTMFDEIRKFVGTASDVIIVPEPPKFEVILTPERLGRVLFDLVAAKGPIAFDIETDQINYREDNILLMVLSNKGSNYIIPGRHPKAPTELLYSTMGDPTWEKFWEASNVFVGHNAKFDIRFLRHQLGMKARVDFDTMLAHYSLDERKGTHDLKGLAAQGFNVPDYEVSLKNYLKSRNDAYSKVDWATLCQYAAWDGYCTLGLYNVFKPLVSEWPFYNVLMPLNRVLIEAELRGFRVDVDHLIKHSKMFEKELGDIAGHIKKMSNDIVENPNSSQQMSNFIYGFLGLPQPRGRKIKEGSTSKDALAQLKGKHPAIDLVLRYRRIAKLKSSYFDNLRDMLDDDDRIHCDFNIHGTETGRLSVREPALQTIPRANDREEGQYGVLIKQTYCAAPGRSLVICDFSQAELRVAAALSGEPFLLQVYKDDRDLHSEVAKGMYGEEYTKEQRVLCKMFNFSYLYGGNENSFAMDSGLNIETARQFVRDYDSLMPRLKEWKDERVREMRTKGYVLYRTGRKRRIPFVTRENEDDARKAAFNSVVQGSASDVTSLAAVALADLGLEILLLVHDSIIVECDDFKVKDVAALMAQVMEDTGNKLFPEVKWKAEAEYGDRWGSTHKIE